MGCRGGYRQRDHRITSPGFYRGCGIVKNPGADASGFFRIRRVGFFGFCKRNKGLGLFCWAYLSLYSAIHSPRFQPSVRGESVPSLRAKWVLARVLTSVSS